MLSDDTILSVSSLFAKYGKEAEIEVKFGYFNREYFSSTVPWVKFHRLKDLMQNNKYTTFDEVSTDYREGDVRKRVIHSADGDEDIWQLKQRIQDFDNRLYDLRLSVNREVPTVPVQFKNPTIRDRHRTSFIMDDGICQLDMTEVDMIVKGKMKKLYEVELEFKGTIDQVHSMNTAIEFVYRVLHGTRLTYTTLERDQLLVDINKALGAKKQSMTRDLLVKSRNLKFKDMVYGGLVGNRKTTYTVTHKADGQRKILVFHSTGIWFIYPPFEFDLAIRGDFASLSITMMDGELVPHWARRNPNRKEDYWFLVFDVIALLNGTDVQDKPHSTRMEMIRPLARVSSDMMLIDAETKKFTKIDTVNEFYEVMRSMFREKALLAYEDDGFVFTPENTPYNPGTDQLIVKDIITKKDRLIIVKERVLTRYPDVCKWKPVEKLTIDFAITWVQAEPNRRSLRLSSISDDGQLVQFNGTSINSFNGNVDVENPLIRNVRSGKIVEFSWDGDKFVPFRLRTDKVGPNGVEIAEDNWDAIHAPITQADLSGETFTLLYKVHNRIKSRLLQLLPNGSTLLDLGSGQGGDLIKWSHLSKVVAVEPDSAHITEFNRRLSLLGMQNKVKILQADAEDTDTITQFVGQRVDAIALMLSMTFFWKDNETLDRLANTIISNLKPGGRILFLTMDGDAVRQAFAPALNGPQLSEVRLGPATINYLPDQPQVVGQGHKIHINIDDTIVVDQDEYLVRVTDLVTRLKQMGAKIAQQHVADSDEKFLTPAELKFTSLFSYGWITTDNFDPNKMSRIAVGPRLETPKTAIQPSTGLSVPLTTGPSVPVVLAPSVGKQEVTFPIAKPVIVPSSVPILSPQSQIDKLPPNNLLTMLYVNSTKSATAPGQGDDTYEPVKCTWFDGKLVRIATIGDGNCFVHAVAKAYYPLYQETPSYRWRVQFTSELRRDLAALLAVEDAGYNNRDHSGHKHTNWETAGNGAFTRTFLQQLANPDLIEVIGVDYSLKGLQALINSSATLGDEIYQYISDSLQIDIYVLRATKDDLYPHLTTSRKNIKRRSIIIAGNSVHYEVIAVDTPKGFQTIFDPEDPLIVTLDSIYVDKEPANANIDIDRLFTDEYTILFTKDGVLQPAPFLDKFSKDDPFVLLYNRNIKPFLI